MYHKGPSIVQVVTNNFEFTVIHFYTIFLLFTKPFAFKND